MPTSKRIIEPGLLGVGATLLEHRRQAVDHGDLRAGGRREHRHRAAPVGEIEPPLARRGSEPSTSSAWTGASTAARRSVIASPETSVIPSAPSACHLRSPGRPRSGAYCRVANLFDEAAGRRLRPSPRSPSGCARRARPFVGQEHVIGPGRALRLAIEADRVPSLILFGPPGSGKTTLARIVANTTGAEFEELSAVSATVANVREVLARARRATRGRRAPHDPVPRRDPPLQQGAAGRAPAGHRGGPRHADRRDDREPVLRAQLGAPLADAAATSSRACRRTTSAS